MRRRHLSGHYRFFFEAGSLAERCITDIAARQEECCRLICQALKVQLPGPIRYYLCGAADEVGRLYGDNEPANACTKTPDKVYAVYNEALQCLGMHEDAHIISYLTIGRPEHKLLREGLAMYFDRLWWGIPNEAWARRWLVDRGSSTCRLTELCSNARFDALDEVVSYPIAGAFVHQLVRLGGMDRFKELYRTAATDLDVAVRSLYCATIETMELDMLAELRMMRFDPCILHRMHELDAERGRRPKPETS